MKRLFLILCGTLALAACNKTAENSLRTGEGNAEGRIVFRAEQPTKSVTESTASVLQANGFKVAAVTGTTTFFNENVSYVSENAWFETAQTYYYPSVATNFFAVYPKTQAISIDGTGAATLTYISDGNTDLIAAKALDVVSRETPQPLTFDHILSQVIVKCQGSDANATYVVKSVTLSNTDAATYAYSSGAWTGANKAKASAIVSSNTAASTSSFTTMGEAVTAVPAEMDLRVTWDCLQGSTVVGSYDETVTFTPTIGKVCTVNCTLPNKDAKAIKFTINVNPWGEENVNLSLERVVNITIDDTFGHSLANIATKSTDSTPIDVDYILDGLEEEAEVNVIMSDGEFSVSTDITDFSSPETDGGKIYLTSNSDETKGYSYEIYYDEGEWKIKNTGYLIFKAITDGTIVWRANNNSGVKTILYSRDSGSSWSEWTSSTAGTAIDVNTGETIFIKGSGTTLNTSGIYSFFTNGTANYYVYGNINALINNSSLSNYVFNSLFISNSRIKNHPTNKILLPSTVLSEQCYSSLFYNCSGLTTPPELPATTLASYCYSYMFYDCSGLTIAPELPATIMASGCYNMMFYGCTGLTTAPVLPGTTLAFNCYCQMFYGCTGLTTPPALPVTTLAQQCYYGMFQGCTGLTSAPILPALKMENKCYAQMFYECTALTAAPELPATQLAQKCYESMFLACKNLITAPELPATNLFPECYGSMFSGCTSLTSAPVLPATTLSTSCYRNMFRGCKKLNYIKALFTTTPGETFTYGWLYNVSSTGTFVKNSAASWNVTGDSGIPSGWTVQTASE